jgi:hypothetical protein
MSKRTEYAFPWANDESKQYNWIHPGMTLRDWFAGQALAGLLADHTVDLTRDEHAKAAYAYADAMLEERAKSGGRQ